MNDGNRKDPNRPVAPLGETESLDPVAPRKAAHRDSKKQSEVPSIAGAPTLYPAQFPELTDYQDLAVVDPAHYVIGNEVARGGMGSIRTARDRRLGRTVAIKQLAPGAAAARFEREALITAKLQHPAIIPVYEAGRLPSGEPFYAMRLIPGKSLDREVETRTTLADRIALLPNLIAAVDAVAYAHTNRVIHRDLKPSNILIGEFGETVVIDWGLAKNLDETADHVPDAGPYRNPGKAHTIQGSVLGTPAFMAPEQSRGEAVGERADVYSLGAVLYYVLAGRPPVDGTTLEEVLKKTADGTIEPLSIVQPGAPHDLAAIVGKALSRSASDRYASAAELATDLKRFQTGQLVGAHRYSAWQLLARQLRRHRGIFVVASLAVLSLVTTLAIAGSRLVRAKQDAERGRAQLDTVARKMLTEQGREALLAGHPGRALAYLIEATRGGTASSTQKYLLHEAMRPFDAERSRLAVPDSIYSATADPNGTFLATGHPRGRIDVWKAQNGAHVTTLTADTDRDMISVAFSRDAEQVVGVASDGIVRVWTVATAKLDASFAMSDCDSAVFSNDGKVFASAPDRTTLWNPSTGRSEHDFAGGAALRSGAVSEDGSKLATYWTGAANLWDVRTGKEIGEFRSNRNVLTAAISRDGTRIATGDLDGNVKLWNAMGHSAPLVLRGHREDVTSIAFSANGRWLITTSTDQTTRVWDARNGSSALVVPSNWQPVVEESFSPDGNHVAIAASDNTLCIWRVVSGRRVGCFETHTAEVRTPRFLSTGDLFAFGGDRRAIVWDVMSLYQPGRRVFEDGNYGAQLDVSPSGEALLVLTMKGNVTTVLDRASGKLGRKFDLAASHAIFSPSGSEIVTTESRGIVVRSAQDGRVIAGRQHPSTVYIPAGFTQDGGIILVDGMLQSWDSVIVEGVTASGKEVRDWRQFGQLAPQVWWRGQHYRRGLGPSEPGDDLTPLDPNEPVFRSSWLSPRGKFELGYWNGGSVNVFERTWANPKPSFMLPQSAPVTWTSYSADGLLIGTASKDGAIRLWNAATGAAVTTFWVKPQYELAAFSPDGGRIAAGSDDGTVFVFDTATGNPLASYDVIAGVTALAFSPDGAALVAATSLGAIFELNVAQEHRDSKAIDEIINNRDPWRYVEGRLVSAGELGEPLIVSPQQRN